MTAPVEPMTAEEEARMRAYLATGTDIDGPPNDPVADLVRRMFATIDALRALVAKVTAERDAHLRVGAMLTSKLHDLRALAAAQAKVIAAADTLRHCPPFRRELAASAFDAARAALGDGK